MSTVRRVYVEKKPEFAIKAKDLKHEIKHYLNIQISGRTTGTVTEKTSVISQCA